VPGAESGSDEGGDVIDALRLTNDDCTSSSPESEHKCAMNQLEAANRRIRESMANLEGWLRGMQKVVGSDNLYRVSRDTVRPMVDHLRLKQEFAEARMKIQEEFIKDKAREKAEGHLINAIRKGESVDEAVTRRDQVTVKSLLQRIQEIWNNKN
jgi:hypothetical protein